MCLGDDPMTECNSVDGVVASECSDYSMVSQLSLRTPNFCVVPKFGACPRFISLLWQKVSMKSKPRHLTFMDKD